MSPPINIDGSQVSGITIDGTEVTEVTVGGDTVFGAIPDSVIAQYQFEDNANTTTAVDSIGSNDLTLNGQSYTSSTVKCGSLALDDDATDSPAESQSTVDLPGDNVQNEMSIAAYVNPDVSDSNEYVFGWQESNDSDWLFVRFASTGFQGYLRVGGTNIQTSGGTISNGSYEHVAVVADNSEIIVYQNASQVAQTSHSLDLSNLGSGTYLVGHRRSEAGDGSDGQFDNVSFANTKLSQSEIQKLVDQCT